MREVLRQSLAVAFGLLLVTAGALGSVAYTNPGVSSFGDASGAIVGSANAQAGSLLGGNSLVMAAYGKFQDLVSNPDTENLQKADALETKKAIYDSGSIQKENNDLLDTAYSNYLNDTQSIALMEGKNAYIRALENGSSESVARNRATEAVADYYAVKQQNIIASWNVSATVANSSHHTADNTTGIAGEFAAVDYDETGPQSGSWGPGPSDIHGLETRTVSLVNASSETMATVNVTLSTTTDGTDYYNGTGTVTFLSGDSGVLIPDGSGSDYGEAKVDAFDIHAPNDNYDRLLYGNFSDYRTRWSEIEQQNDEVQRQLDDFVNATYTDYQQGDINTSDLVDPYLGAREYSPETSDTWALRTLTSMGAGSPENLSNIGLMNVSVDNTTYTGVLMSDGTPENTTGFQVGGTYNASNITGGQFIALNDGGVYEIGGQFTLESAETIDGETYAVNETVEYNTVEYSTANTTEFQELQTELDKLTAEINARQQELRNSGGTGWLPGFGDVSLGQVAPIALLAGGALVLLARS